METVKVLPRTRYSNNPPVEPIDGWLWLSPDFLKYGRPAEIVREGVDFPELGDNNFYRLIKAPGSDVHRFPASMRDLGQEIADHQYSVSPAARHKACIIMYRKTQLSLNRRLLADTWHIHAVPKGKENILGIFALAHNLLTQGTLRPSLLGLSPDLSWNEYLLSDIEPTFVQASPSKSLFIIF